MTHFWLRHETKANEHRCSLLPSHASKLIAKGHTVTVERSPVRTVPDSDYEAVGCTLVAAETWPQAPLDAVILGLKELKESTDVIPHSHIMFGHCFKGQDGDKAFLTRFKNGGGKLYDLEFLQDTNGRRVAAFGRAAGTVGMAIGLLVWSYRILHPEEEKPTPPLLDIFQTYEDLVKYVVSISEKAIEKAGRKPSAIVIGALGRCGGGSCDFAVAAGVEKLARWDMAETKVGGPFPQILDYDILVNDIYLSVAGVPPFITKELIARPDKTLGVIVDVSCDVNNAHNPLPVYDSYNDFDAPTTRLSEGIDVVCIDHLPSMVPHESSSEFVDALLPHLIEFETSDVFKRALAIFEEKVVSVVGE
eukprot:TRINITY_DN921_c0_g1_i1.p1 TRINITY_DN921_c0_g1~~TRINITY_DN921_c0_g1_i1.p1  ORF type:complete len:362 (+),score=81.30 TRINITY_DN921_c0_g1_i1:60-1145(+)